MSTRLRLGIASHATSSKHVYRPCSGNNTSTDPRSPRNHALLPRANLDVFSVHGDRVATLDNEEVLVKFMNMLLGIRVCAAFPERDLSPVGSVEDVPLDICGVLRRRCDPIRPALHEARKLMHALGANLSGSRVSPARQRLEAHETHRGPTRAPRFGRGAASHPATANRD
jgi:hypothetical protein